MSLFGAMFTGVTGLNAQSKKIGVISDNIANVNTVGYKRGDAQFESLVIGSGTSSGSAPGGVIPNTRLAVDQQGLLTSTNAATDIAISGRGFFIVRENASGSPLYTRAGSFRTNEDGDLQNAQGYILQGWPLDSAGHLPGEPGNLNTTASSTFDSLKAVNINAASGQAKATTEVKLSANLDAGEKIFPGAAFTANMDTLSIANKGIGGDDIIATSEYGMAPTNSIVRGDQLKISTGNGIVNYFTYGGFSVGRKITVSGSGNVGDNGVVTGPRALTAGNLATTNLSTSVTLSLPTHNLQSGAVITLSGFANTGGIPAAELNGSHTVTVIDANTVSFTVTTAATSSTGSAGGESALLRPYVGNILDALTENQAFLGTTGVSQFAPEALQLVITTNTTGPKTFSYITGSPNAAAGQFNSLATLAQAINAVSGMNARVVDGRLMVSADDANEAVTFANGDTDGVVGPPAKQGIDWVGELGLANITTGSDRFNTLRGLYNLAQNAPGISATLASPTSKSSLSINVDDPLDTLSISDYVQSPATTLGNNPLTISGAGPSYTVTVADPTSTYQVGDKVVIAGASGFGGAAANELNGTFTVTSVGAGTFSYTITPVGVLTPGAGGGAGVTRATTNIGSLAAELGLVNSLNGNAFTPQTTGVTGPIYDSSGISGKNIASGGITPQFSRQIRVYDALGTGHDISIGFIKVDANRWAVEAYVVPKSDVATSLPDGQIATGFISFNGDGTLRSVDSALSNPINVNWTGGASPGAITINWGTAGPQSGTLGSVVTIGQADGLRQYDEDYDVGSQSQDGSASGYLVNLEITEEGQVVASFSNGKTQALYQLPIADFANPNGLRALTGNVFTATQESGDVNMRKAGLGGMGEVRSNSLESSNVDLAAELTDMIVAQRAYQSNTRVISTVDNLLEQLTNLGR